MVDDSEGATLIKNSVIKRLEDMQRLRIERLHRVYDLLRRRGLSCYPKHPSWPDDWWRFVVYRPELATVHLATIAADDELIAAAECVQNAFRYPYAHENAPYPWQMHDALQKLAAA
ncbi:hypothetical protein CTZ27_26265 [Streptomyces griseocarneus]|nr:hypothetical protein CTZ27_26265 [Streptomyces griseocarneus]